MNLPMAVSIPSSNKHRTACATFATDSSMTRRSSDLNGFRTWSMPVTPSRGLADSHPDPGELLACDGVDDGLDAIVARGAAASTDPYSAKGQVHLVVNYEQVPRRGCETGQQIRDGGAAVVHEGPGLGQYDLVPVHRAPAQHRRLAPLPEGHLPLAGHVIYAPESHVVTAVDVSSAGVSQADDQLHGALGHSRMKAAVS